jgi:hypothetical protein
MPAYYARKSLKIATQNRKRKTGIFALYAANGVRGIGKAYFAPRASPRAYKRYYEGVDSLHFFCIFLHFPS